MLNILAAFEETSDKYGMNNDEFVKMYDSIAKAELQEHLVEITHYYNTHILQRTYYFHKSTHAIYGRLRYVLKSRKPTKIDLFQCKAINMNLVKWNWSI